jgi:hypothetical protein
LKCAKIILDVNIRTLKTEVRRCSIAIAPVQETEGRERGGEGRRGNSRYRQGDSLCRSTRVLVRKKFRHKVTRDLFTNITSTTQDQQQKHTRSYPH